MIALALKCGGNWMHPLALRELVTMAVRSCDLPMLLVLQAAQRRVMGPSSLDALLTAMHLTDLYHESDRLADAAATIAGVVGQLRALGHVEYAFDALHLESIVLVDTGRATDAIPHMRAVCTARPTDMDAAHVFAMAVLRAHAVEGHAACTALLTPRFALTTRSEAVCEYLEAVTR
jgi:hypothetical protein